MDPLKKGGERRKEKSVVRLRRTPTESEDIAALTHIGQSVVHIQTTSVATLRWVSDMAGLSVRHQSECVADLTGIRTRRGGSLRLRDCAAVPTREFFGLTRRLRRARGE